MPKPVINDESDQLKEYIQEEWESFKVTSLNNGFRIGERDEGKAFVLFMCGVLSGVNYPGPRKENIEKEAPI